MINTNKTVNNYTVSYEIMSDGYEIYLDGQIWIEQRGQYSKPMDKDKTFEENCLMQIEELTAIPEPPNNEYGVGNETYNAIIDDYTMSLIDGGILG